MPVSRSMFSCTHTHTHTHKTTHSPPHHHHSNNQLINTLCKSKSMVEFLKMPVSRSMLPDSCRLYVKLPTLFMSGDGLPSDVKAKGYDTSMPALAVYATLPTRNSFCPVWQSVRSARKRVASNSSDNSQSPAAVTQLPWMGLAVGGG